jgi:hypothetical protein
MVINITTEALTMLWRYDFFLEKKYQPLKQGAILRQE